MNLFSYERKFKANTNQFKSDINDFIATLHGKRNYGTIALLNKLLSSLDEIACPRKADKKKQAAVDERIDDLIKEMRRLCRTGKFVEFAKYVELLDEAINDSRRYGEEAYTEEQIKLKKVLASIMGTIEDNLNEQGKIESTMAALKAQALNCTKGSAEYKRIESQFDECDKRLKNIREIVETNRTVYNSQLSAELLGEQEVAIARLEQSMVISSERFVARVEALNARKSKITDESNVIQDAANEMFSVSENAQRSESALDNAIIEEKERQLTDSFANIKINKPQEKESALDRELRNGN